MRTFIKDFCRIAEETLDLRPPIVEIGSYQVGGQDGFADLRPIFRGKQYVGCDMRAGPGVDRVENLPNLSFPSASIRTIVCLDTLEHVYEVRESIAEFHRVLSADGILVLSSVFNFSIHGHPYDFWRFTPQCFARLLTRFSCRLIGAQGSESQPHTVYGIGFKGTQNLDKRKWFVGFERVMKSAMKANFHADVNEFLARRIARRGIIAGIARYPRYAIRRRRYKRDQEVFYKLKLHLLNDANADWPENQG